MPARTASRFSRIRLRAAALIVAVPLVLSGCGDYSTSTSYVEPSFEGSSGGYYESDRAVASTEESFDSNAQFVATNATNVKAEPMLIVEGSLHLDVKDPQKALEDASKVVSAAGGHLSSSEFRAYLDNPTAYATFKIPADSFESVRQELMGLGKVTSQTTTSTDVGAEVADLNARAAALQASIERLTELMKSAEYTSDLLEAERELTTRQAELDSLNGQRVWYADRVSYSTLDVQLRSDAIAPVVTPSAWEESWDLFLESLGAMIYMLIILLPWLILIVPLGFLIAFLVRRGNKRRAEKRAKIQALRTAPPVPHAPFATPNAPVPPATQHEGTPGACVNVPEPDAAPADTLEQVPAHADADAAADAEKDAPHAD